MTNCNNNNEINKSTMEILKGFHGQSALAYNFVAAKNVIGEKISEIINVGPLRQ